MSGIELLEEIACSERWPLELRVYTRRDGVTYGNAVTFTPNMPVYDAVSQLRLLAAMIERTALHRAKQSDER